MILLKVFWYSRFKGIGPYFYYFINIHYITFSLIVCETVVLAFEIRIIRLIH